MKGAFKHKDRKRRGAAFTALSYLSRGAHALVCLTNFPPLLVGSPGR